MRAALEASGLTSAELRPGMRCLLTILGGGDPDWKPDDAEWEDGLRLASTERVLPWFLFRLEEDGRVLSPPVEALVQGARRETAVESFFWRAQLKGLLQSFHEEALAVIPLKGPALAERLYGGVTRRTCQDLDLLVQAHDFARAQRLLARLGFAPGKVTSYQQKWVRGSMLVELHRDVSEPRVFDFHISGAWRAARPICFEGVPAWQFSPEDEFLFLCLHAVRHEFNRLSVVLDVALATQLLGGQTAPELRPEVCGLRRHGELGYHMAQMLLPSVCLPVHHMEAVPRARWLAPVAAALTQDLLTRVGTGLGWRARQNLHLQLESDAWSRWRRRWSHLGQMLPAALTAEVAERDLEFARGWGCTRPWQARALRPLRLACRR